MEYKADILLNPCGNDRNFTNITYQIHVPDGITWVRLQEVHEGEVFLIIRQLRALKENHTDLVIMSSKLMSAFPVQNQQSFAPMEASEYSEKHIRDSAIQHHTRWLLFLFSNDVIGQRILNNISLDNLALIVLETEDRIEQKICHSIESILLADECAEHGVISGTESLKHTIARLFHSNNLCRKFTIQTLMWRDDGRELSPVGSINLNGEKDLHSDVFPNVDFGFNQRKFIVSTQPVFPFEYKTNNSFEGLCIDLLAQLAVELNFTFEVIVSPDGDFGVMLDNGSWTGLIGQLQRKDVDLVAGPLSITIQREHVMDFIHPFFHDHSVVLIQKPDPQETKWRTLIDPYSDTVIISIGLSLPLASLVLVVLENISPVYSREDRAANESDLNSFLGSFWYLFGALLTQGGKYTPYALSGRLFVGMWWLFCIISLATYSGNLIASLTVSKEKLPFKSLKEMVSQDKFKWGTYGGTVFVTMFKVYITKI
ncbi:glutamate receptor ionotropic, kainate 3-like [Pecten maximus]|uniref:glutamate receptor ionotropic, kainate 3-like n=1 Tax=Pecten maximus TaxID=6579 RepID=UPI001458641E|nr:glutamate receptor ionotropic, kainate 3-like [Pecten maximus]